MPVLAPGGRRKAPAVRELTRLAALPMAAAALALPPPSSAQAARRTDEAAVIRAINAQRAANGLPALRRDRSLTTLARAHSAHMVAHERFSHGAFGRRIAHTAWAHRRAHWAAGETLAWGTGALGTPDGVVAAWMQSPHHRRILLNRRYRVIGVGAVNGVPVGGARGQHGRTYTADFGS